MQIAPSLCRANLFKKGNAVKAIEFSCLMLSAAAMSGALALGAISTAHAASAAAPAPNKQAIAACQGKKEGDAVQLDIGNGKSANAACRKVNGQLIALRSASIGP